MISAYVHCTIDDLRLMGTLQSASCFLHIGPHVEGVVSSAQWTTGFLVEGMG